MTWSPHGQIDLKGILGPPGIHFSSGNPSRLFTFLNPSPASPGEREDCGDCEEQQVVSAGVSAMHSPQGTGRAGWAWGSW